jgi:ATP-dependent RNA/DNA helicase IGHMBP2
MYNGKLISHESVKNRKLCTLRRVQEQLSAKESDNVDEDTIPALQNVVLTLIDTSGCGFHEMTTDAGSRYNEGEAELVVQHVQSLLSLGLRAEDIAVITPYNGQVELLRKRLLPEVPKLEIRSVDGFQGGEREAVVLSLVRSSERGGKDGVGFLRDERRLNVAVTRAKRHCAVICDCETVSQIKFIKGLIDWIEKKGEYCSAAELVTPHASCHSQSTSTASLEKKPSPGTINKKQMRIKKKEAPPNESASHSAAVGAASNSEQTDDSKLDALKEGAKRRALMNRISQFSETGHKEDRLELRDLSDFDRVVSQELASQLGLGCNTSNDNVLTLCILKEARANCATVEPELNNEDKNTTAFSRLDISDDESSHGDIAYTAESAEPSIILKDLALERQKRQGLQTQMQSTLPATQVKKNSKKKKGQKLGGQKKQAKEPDDEQDDLDDMAFLDAQIEKVQTSHGRKIDAKGKGYKSIVNGVLLTKYDRPETKRTNTAAANSLQAKIKAKSEDRHAQVKKKKGK